MAKELAPRNIDILGRTGVLDLPDGTKLFSLTPLEKRVLQLLIDRSLNGHPASKTELKEVYEADGVHKAGKDGITIFITRLNRLLKDRNVDYVIKNLTSKSKRNRGIEANYFFTTKEDQQKQPPSISPPMLKTESPENPNIAPKPYEGKKAELIRKKRQDQIELRLTLNVLSCVAKGETTQLNRLVQIHMEKAALSQGVTFLAIFEGMSFDQVKSSFIKTIDSVMEAYWDFIPKNPGPGKPSPEESPEETELAKQCANLKNSGYTTERVIRELCRHFDILIPEKYIL